MKSREDRVCGEMAVAHKGYRDYQRDRKTNPQGSYGLEVA